MDPTNLLAQIDPVWINLAVMLIKSIVWIVVLLMAFAYVQYVERRVVARIQVRIGPNRVGPFGLFQPIADAVKLLFKEDFTPGRADKVVYILAPAIAVITALLAFAVIPVGPSFSLFGYKIDLFIADINIAVLYLLAVGSLSVYGVVLAGWGANNKYSMMGGLRSTAQMVSYEIAMGLSLVGVLMLSSTLSLTKIVEQQTGLWNIVLQPLGFVIYYICAIAEVNRLPFDLPEAETELIAGYLTEYASIKVAFFFMAEYINMMTVSAIAVSLFWGGWQAPFGLFPGWWWFVIKVALSLFLFMWLRGTFPRFRYDQLMNFGWKILFPLALVNIAITIVEVVVFRL